MINPVNGKEVDPMFDGHIEKPLSKMTPEEKLEMIDKVSVDDIKKVAEDIFKSEKLNLSVIGQIEETEKANIEKILKL